MLQEEENVVHAITNIYWIWERHPGGYRDEGGTVEEMESSRRDKICTQIILKEHKVLRDMRKENYLFWWESGRIHELWLGEQVRFPQGKRERWFLRYKRLSRFSARMWGDKTGEAHGVWTCSALSNNPVGVENSMKTFNWTSWSRQFLEAQPGSCLRGGPKGGEARGSEWLF